MSKRAIIYTRVSTGRQEEEGTSLASQEAACRAYAEQHGYTIERVTREVYTGAELWDRPYLAQDRTDIKAGKAQALIVYAIDRLSRDPVHLAIIADECERAGAELHFVTEPLDTSPEAMLILYVKGYAGRVEREKIRERVLRGKKTRALQGKVSNAGFDLYGYRREKEAGVRVIYEPEARHVRQIFTWVGIEGLSLKAVIRRLTEEGVPPPSVGKIRRYSTSDKVPQWGTGTLGRMLRERAYIGEAYAWRYKGTRHNGKYKSGVSRPREEWIALPEQATPAIVSIDLWNAVQHRLDTNHGEHTRNLNKARRYLLRGLVYCAVCGRRMYGEPKEKTPYYRCSSRRSTGGKCGSSSILTRYLDAWVWDQVSAVLRDPSIIAAEVERVRGDEPDPILKGDLEAANRSLARIDRQQERLIGRFRAAENDDFPWELVEREIVKLEKEKGNVKVTIAEIEQRLAQQQRAVAQLEELQTYCARVWHNLERFDFDDQRLALDSLDVKVYVNGRDWRLVGRIPINGGVLSQSS